MDRYKAIVLLVLLAACALSAQKKPDPPARSDTVVAAADTILPRQAVLDRITRAIEMRQRQQKELQDEILHLQGMWQGVNVVRDSLVKIDKRWWQ